MNDRADDQPDVPPPPGATPGVPGWYPDPWSTKGMRYWTGAAWTFSTKTDDAPGAAVPGAAGPTPQAAPAQPAPPPAPAQTGVTPEAASPGPVARATHFLLRPRLLVAVALGLLLGVVGVAILDRSSGSSDSAATRTPTTITPSPGSSAPPTGDADPSASALISLVVNQSDVEPPLMVTVLPGGSGLRQPTLDLCNGRFPSDSRRTARLQDAVVDGHGAVIMSTEAVLYADSAATSQAFSELRAIVAACPATPVPGPGGEPTITRFSAPPDSSWPQTATVNRLAFDFTSDNGTGEPTRTVAVYLQRGRALLGVYFYRPDDPQPAVAGETTVSGIVGVLAARLAALPTSVVGS